MSEEATPAPEPTRAEKIDAAWAAAEASAPEEISPEALNEKPAATRESVAPSIREFIRAQTAPEPGPTSALEAEIAELRGALNSIAQNGQAPETTTPEQDVLAKLQALENREAERQEQDAEARSTEEFNQRVAGLRAGALENINARAQDFPGLIALDQQETVINAVFQRSEEGQETSEDEVASEVEDGLREVYQKLHAVYGSAPSEAPAPVSERPKTLTPAAAGTDEEPDVSNMSRREKIDYLWSKNQ